MTLPSNYCRIAILGASSLRGKDLSAAIEERGFPATDVRLLDDEVVDGTLTESSGEPIIIQGVDEESFDGVRFAFFAGEPELTARHWQQAARAGCTIIDMSGHLASEPNAIPWIPSLRKLLPAPRPTSGKLFSSPAPAAIVACTLAVALRECATRRPVVTVFVPVSERGQDGIDELESQTVGLLSMKPIASGVFDAQVAFNLLAQYGADCRPRLQDISATASREVKNFLAGRLPEPALQLIQAPVFYGNAFSAFVDAERVRESGELERALEAAGLKVAVSAEDAPSTVTIAGESVIRLARVERDASVPGGFWIWGAADNLRLASANAISIAETLLAS